MANNLSPELVYQLLSQESTDPFLTLLTLTHDSFDTIRFVNNTKDIVSRGETYLAFPFKIRFPVDDGESVREFSIELDNVSLELVDEIRSVTSQIGVTIELILASMPDDVQITQGELKIQSIQMTKQRISAKIIVDDFLNVEMTGEKYEPSNFPGLF
jgi:hypothetical protein